MQSDYAQSETENSVCGSFTGAQSIAFNYYIVWNKYDDATCTLNNNSTNELTSAEKRSIVQGVRHLTLTK